MSPFNWLASCLSSCFPPDTLNTHSQPLRLSARLSTNRRLERLLAENCKTLFAKSEEKNSQLHSRCFSPFFLFFFFNYHLCVARRSVRQKQEVCKNRGRTTELLKHGTDASLRSWAVLLGLHTHLPFGTICNHSHLQPPQSINAGKNINSYWLLIENQRSNSPHHWCKRHIYHHCHMQTYSTGNAVAVPILQCNLELMLVYVLISNIWYNDNTTTTTTTSASTSNNYKKACTYILTSNFLRLQLTSQ